MADRDRAGRKFLVPDYTNGYWAGIACWGEKEPRFERLEVQSG